MPVPGPVLLVIDDPGFRGRLLVALRGMGLRVALFGDGDQARQFLAVEFPSIAIVDARLPGEGGVPWVRARRAEGDATPMLLLVASTQEAESLLPLATELGVAAVVSKEVPAESLAAHVAGMLGVAAPPPPPAEPAGAPDAAGAEIVAAAVEAFRVSIVNLQKNAERLERIQSSIVLAKKLRTAAKAHGFDGIASGAARVEEMLVESCDGRRRLDGGTWPPIEKFIASSQEAASRGATAVSAPAQPTPPPRKTLSSSAHEDPGEISQPGRRMVTEGIDEISGLPTRDAFLQMAIERVESAALEDRHLSAAVIAVEHAAALRAARQLDLALETLGKFLSGRFRPEDATGRWLVDGFAVAFPGTPLSMANNHLARMLATFDALPPLEGGTKLRLSIGLAAYPKDGADAPSVLAVAERRMLAARQSGGGTIRSS